MISFVKALSRRGQVEPPLFLRPPSQKYNEGLDNLQSLLIVNHGSVALRNLIFQNLAL